jgi:hypothetical protein
MSRCVNVQVANGLDTHFDNWESDQGHSKSVGLMSSLVWLMTSPLVNIRTPVSAGLTTQ